MSMMIIVIILLADALLNIIEFTVNLLHIESQFPHFNARIL